MADKRWWSLLGLLFVLSLVLRHEMLFLFAILLALASGASVLWFRYCLHGVTYKRRLKDERIFGGEETELTIDVINAKPLPLPWLLIRDRFPKEITLLTGALDGAQQREATAQQQETSVLNLTDLLALRWYERVQRTYRVRGEQRGAYTFGPAGITAGDIFGFGRKQAHIKTTDQLIVYPRVVPIDRLGLPAERPSGAMKALRRVIEDPLRMATVREYVPGDSIRHIHWKNTARLNQLQTKVFDPSSTPVLTLFVDLQTVHNPYGLITEYLELGISAAASIAIHALDLRHAVGVYANGGPRGANNWTMIPPGRSPGQGSQILEALAPLFGFRLIPLYQLLRRLMPSLPYGCTVVAISAQATEALLGSLLTLQDAGHPVVLLTVGDDRPEIPETFVAFHLGGRDAWRRLETLELA
jgi:uncharacterized protein (DUF58 family)